MTPSKQNTPFGFGLLMVVALVSSTTAFSTQQPLSFSSAPSLSLGSTMQSLKLSYPAATATRLWGRLDSNDDDIRGIQERDIYIDSPMDDQKHQNFLGTTAKKAAAVAGVALLATTAFPTMSHASLLESNVEAGAGFLSRIAETGFYQAFSLVFVSEIGDKTFFIAGLLAMKTSRLVAYLGSMGALGAMTILSVLIGQIFHAVPSGLGGGLPLDDIFAVLAFAFFGVKTIKDALDLEEGESVMDEELAEAEEEVEDNSAIFNISAWGQFASIFALVFAAEFGDRSFLSTIALSAAQNPVSVAGGAIAAHGVATGIAVSGGSYIAKYISERAIGIIGGSLFLVFAVTTALGIF